MKFKCLGRSGFRTNTVRTRLRTIGLSKDDSWQMVSLLDRLIKNNGVEFTIDWLKKVKSLIYSYHRGQSHFEPRISLTDGYPTQLIFLLKYPIDVQFRIANAHKFFTYCEPTSKQVSKFTSAVTRDYIPYDILDSVLRYVKLGISDFHKEARTLSFMPAKPLYVPSHAGNKTMPVGTSVVPRDRRSFISNVRAMIWDLDPYGHGYNILLNRAFRETLGWLDETTGNPYVDTVISQACDSMYDQTDGYLNHYESMFKPRVGVIGMTQEPGGKLRCFANPNIIVQNMLEPLFQALRKCVQEDPNDFSLNQDAGKEYIFNQIRSRKNCHYYDLSNATDMFPLELQLKWMIQCDYDISQILLFKEVARGDWSAPMLRQDLNWTVGQPLGLKPSFYSFSTTHSMLIRGICKSLCRPFDYAVVGDDVAIFDDGVAEVYCQIMSDLGIALSDSKISSGQRFVEFCGSILDIKHHSFTISKHKPIKASNVMSLFRVYGTNIAREAFNCLRRSIPELSFECVKTVLETLEFLPEPFGLGKGRGVSLKERLDKGSLVLSCLISSVESSCINFDTSDQQRFVADWRHHLGDSNSPIFISKDKVFINDGKSTYDPDLSSGTRTFQCFPHGIPYEVTPLILNTLNNIFRGIMREEIHTHSSIILNFFRRYYQEFQPV